MRLIKFFRRVLACLAISDGVCTTRTFISFKESDWTPTLRWAIAQDKYVDRMLKYGCIFGPNWNEKIWKNEYIKKLIKCKTKTLIMITINNEYDT